MRKFLKLGMAMALSLPVLLPKGRCLKRLRSNRFRPKRWAMSTWTRTATSFNYSSAGLKDMISEAYQIGKDRISGPAWLDSEMYAVTARIPDGASDKQIPEMLQALLRDRFGVVIHRESKEMAVLALVIGEGWPENDSRRCGDRL